MMTQGIVRGKAEINVAAEKAGLDMAMIKDRKEGVGALNTNQGRDQRPEPSMELNLEDPALMTSTPVIN